MRSVFILILVVGIGLAGAAVYFVQQQFNIRDARERQLVAQINSIERVEMTDVVVAARELRYGTFLEPDDLTTIRWPAAQVPENTFESIETIFGDNSTPRVVLRRIYPDEAVSMLRISGFGLDPGVASRLSPGFRAFTINVDVTSGVSGFLSPGDRVDVFWTGRDGRESVTRLIIDNISIIAVDQTAVEDRNRANIARTVTVEATPAQAATLAQAQSTGRLSLSLRGIQDDLAAGTVEINQDDIVGREPEPEPEPVEPAPAPEPVVIIREVEVEREPEPEEPRRVITIRRGTQSSTIEAN
jgi:pilus assembly protein CpaB